MLKEQNIMLHNHVESSNLESNDQYTIKNIESELHENERNHEKQILEMSNEIETLGKIICSDEIKMLSSNVFNLFEISSSKEIELNH